MKINYRQTRKPLKISCICHKFCRQKSAESKFGLAEQSFFTLIAGISHEIITYLTFYTTESRLVISKLTVQSLQWKVHNCNICHQILAQKCWPQISHNIFNPRKNSAYQDISHILCLARFLFSNSGWRVWLQTAQTRATGHCEDQRATNILPDNIGQKLAESFTVLTITHLLLNIMGKIEKWLKPEKVKATIWQLLSFNSIDQFPVLCDSLYIYKYSRSKLRYVSIGRRW